MLNDRLFGDNPRLFFICTLFIVAVLGVFIRMQFVPLAMSTDGTTYVESAQLLSGDGGTAHPERLLKPLAPLTIAIFAKIFSGNYLYGLLALNIFLYFLFVIAAWYFVRAFFNNATAAFCGALLLLSAYPVLKYGLDYYTDLGSWLFCLIALTSIIVYSRAPSRRNLISAAVIIAAGLLWKEYSVLAGATLGLVVLTQSDISLRERVCHLGWLAFIVALVLGIAQYVVYVKFHFTYLDWYNIGSAALTSSISEHSPWFMGKSLFAVFLLGWALAFLGVFRLRSLNAADRRLLLLIALPLPVIFFWGYVSSRLYFVVAPLLALLAVHGLMSYIESNRRRILVTLCVVLINFGWLFVSDIIRPFF